MRKLIFKVTSHMVFVQSILLIEMYAEIVLPELPKLPDEPHQPVLYMAILLSDAETGRFLA